MARTFLISAALAAITVLSSITATAHEATPMTQTVPSQAIPSQAIPVQTLAPAGDRETSRVIQLVSSIPLAVDLADYALAERAFAPSIVIDYTSLWGGTANTMTPAELMAGWRGIVPGFDATFHELANVRAVVTGTTATASADVDGRHWIGDRLWRPIGTYHWDLVRAPQGGWQVTRMVFTMTQEIGDRALASEAMARAASQQR